MIEILMNTFNGDKYLSEQLNSIFAQYYKDYHLTIVDNSSTDNTVKIINNYIIKYPERITLLINTNPTIDCFHLLLKNCCAEYITFFGHDDVWKKDKLLTQIRLLKQLEETNSKDTPLLVHSDMEIVNQYLVTIQKSYFRFKNQLTEPRLENLLIENSININTCMFNKALLKYSNKIPEKNINFEWWLSLIASSFGEIVFIEEPLTMLRQLAASGENKKTEKTSLFNTYEQANLFLEIFSEDLPINKFKIVSDYAVFSIRSKIYRVASIISKGYRKKTLIEILGQIVSC